MPTDRFARNDDGWRQAWARYVTLEPNHVAVPEDGAASTTPVPGGPPAAATATGATAPQTEPEADDTAVVQYTHTGTRYLLGYGRTFFGIWDRQNAATPVERFPRERRRLGAGLAPLHADREQLHRGALRPRSTSADEGFSGHRRASIAPTRPPAIPHTNASADVRPRLAPRLSDPPRNPAHDGRTIVAAQAPTPHSAA